MKQLIIALTVLASVFSAQADIITAVTTVEGMPSDQFNPGPQTLSTFTDGVGTFTVSQVATGKLGDVGNNPHWGSGPGEVLPANELAALTDARLDTGTLNTGNGTAAAADRFTFSTTISATDKFFIIFNGANDNYVTGASVYNSAGAQLGSELTFSPAFLDTGSEHFDRIDLTRTASAVDLANRRMYGYSFSVSDFAGVTASEIAGVAFTSPNATDYNLVGVAAIPEPSTLALLVAAGMGIFLRKRARS